MSSPGEAGESEAVTFADIFAEVQSLVTWTVQHFVENPTALAEVLSEFNYHAPIADPNVQRMAFGIAVESVVTETVMDDDVLFEALTPQYTINHVDKLIRSDFVVCGDPTCNIDVTSVAQEQAHVDRYNAMGLDVECATYEMPDNLSDLFAAAYGPRD